MKKTGHISSFLSGAAAALTLSLCLTTALAASGKVSYNFANVALDGGTVIAAGADSRSPAPSSTPTRRGARPTTSLSAKSASF